MRVPDHRQPKVDRDWRDVSLKVVAGLAGGVTVSGLVWVGDLAGLHLDPALCGLTVTLLSQAVAYAKRDREPVTK